MRTQKNPALTSPLRPDLLRFGASSGIVRAVKHHWSLDPNIVFLNHGSFGATPIAVLEKQSALRRQMESEPVRFFTRELEPLLDDARATVAAFVGASVQSMAFVTNATAGVNAVLRSLDLDAHDELLVTSHEYNACRNALDYVARVSGARIVAVDIPLPIASESAVVEAIVGAATSRTRLLLIDHITSQTAVRMPVEAILAAMREREIDVLIDGAHAPGMIPLDLEALGAAYYTGNLHKWVCAPKGAAFLYVRENRRRSIRPVVISHGANAARIDRSRFHLEFDWTGTFDPTAWLAVPSAIRTMESLVDGGWPEIMRRNRDLAIRGRSILLQRLGAVAPVPESMLGSMATVPLPDGDSAAAPSLYGDPLQDVLLERFSIEVPIVPWPAPPKRLLRVSAQIYNTIDEYERLADALVELLA